MKAPGPISEVEEIFKNYNSALQVKWYPFARYTVKKYDLKPTAKYRWDKWCKWYLKREKCKEILK